MLETLATVRDLLLVVLGFSFVIFIHELGHFLAARWAGVRVEEFAIGFGKAAASYRKGLGFRRGSSRREYESAVRAAIAGGGPAPALGATEYRLNWLPLGGYVRMLGQADLDPAATSALPDSYTSKPVWKRMVIITAGVVMNMILAAVIFIAVFMVGLNTEPPVVGFVRPESAAAQAKPEGPGGVGLRPGDRVVSIDGTPTRAFRDVALAVAMAGKGEPLEIEVERPGAGALRYAATPTVSEATRLLEIGVGPSVTTQIAEARSGADRDVLRMIFAQAGVPSVEPGASLISIEGAPAESGLALIEAIENSGGKPVLARFRNPGGAEAGGPISPVPELQVATQKRDAGERAFTHLGGLLAPMTVEHVTDKGRESGLMTGDVIAQVGSVEWPDIATAVDEVKRRKGRAVPIMVLRDGAYLRLEPRVSGAGQVGFNIRASAMAPPIAAGTLSSRHGLAASTPASSLFDRANLSPGTVIERVNDRPVATFGALRGALLAAVPESGGEATLRVRLPLGEAFGAGPVETVRLALKGDDVAALKALGWESPVPLAAFEPLRTTLKAEGPAGAFAMGLSETKRMMMRTYLTLLRLTQGSVRVEHLNGPVGIAHLGTMVAEMGAMHLLFFLAVVSVNLAVLNFLPLPIVDGGLFVFLLIEALTRRPVSIAVQSAATMVGLVLLGAVFLVVTFHDISRLFGG